MIHTSMNGAETYIEPEIVFSGSTMTGYLISALLYTMLPVIAFLWAKRQNASRVYPVAVGAIVYFMATTYCNVFAFIMGISESYAAKAALAAELVCIGEEVGRWLAVKYPLGDIKDTRSALCYGIGHAGLECFIRAKEYFKIMKYAGQLNSKGISSFVSGKTVEEASQIVGQLQKFADHPLYLSAFEQLNSIVVFCVQIALSVMLYKKLSETDNEKHWLLLAIGLHYFLNGSVWLSSFSGSTLLMSIVGIISGIIVILIVFRNISLRECLDEIRFTG